MTMILRVCDHTVVSYTGIAIWHLQYYSLTHLYNPQLKSVIEGHGIDCDSKGWVYSDQLLMLVNKIRLPTYLC